MGPLFVHGDIARGFQMEGNRAVLTEEPGLGAELL